MTKPILSNWPLISAIAVWTFGAYLVAKQFRKDRGSPLRFESVGLAVALIPFFLLLGVFVHDLNIHNDKGRPWSPWHEAVVDLFADADKQDLFASVPLTNRHLEFEVSHTRRGRHVFQIWVSAKKEEPAPLKIPIRMKCSFHDEGGRIVGSCETQDWHGGVWSDNTRRLGQKGLRGGSTTCVGVYNVPKDVPLDLKLKAIVDITGDLDAFLREHPDARLIIEKEVYL